MFIRFARRAESIGKASLMWPKALGQIVKNDLKHGPKGSTRADLSYAYAVAGKSYTGTVASFSGSTNATDSKRIVREIPRGFPSVGCLRPQRSVVRRSRSRFQPNRGDEYLRHRDAARGGGLARARVVSALNGFLLIVRVRWATRRRQLIERHAQTRGPWPRYVGAHGALNQHPAGSDTALGLKPTVARVEFDCGHFSLYCAELRCCSIRCAT